MKSRRTIVPGRVNPGAVSGAGSRPQRVLGGRFASLALLLVSLAVLGGCKKTRIVQELVYFDLLSHQFTATREFRSHLAGDSTWYEESLESTGDGNTFALKLLKLQGINRSGLSGAALQEFDGFQARLEQGEGYRVLHQRDFRVEDLSRALQNYRVLVDRSVVPWLVAPPNESYVSFWVLPFVPDRSSYHVTVSMEPGREGFPLSYREFIDVAGVPTLAYEMTVLSLNYGSSSSFIGGSTPLVSRETITLAEATKVSHPLYLPTVLPSGFRLHHVVPSDQRKGADLTGITLDIYGVNITRGD